MNLGLILRTAAHLRCGMSFSYELFMSLIGRIGLEPFSIIIIVLKINVKHSGFL